MAGSVATAIFMLSQLPMLIKAGRTKDLASYSPLNIVLSNIGNVIYAVYVFNLPPGPIWAMHAFYLTATGLMLFWYLRHRTGRSHGNSEQHGDRAPRVGLKPKTCGESRVSFRQQMWGWVLSSNPTGRMHCSVDMHAIRTTELRACSAPNVHGRVAASPCAYRREPDHPGGARLQGGTHDELT
jgi:uncharacterized protein with PQ loop repeat